MDEPQARAPGRFEAAYQAGGAPWEIGRLVLALLKQDYYEMNGMRVKPPSAAQLLADIDGRSVPAGEIERLRGSIRVADDSLLRLVVAT
jgi:hypothetical protein